jgi:hypothetical protein
MAWRSAPLSASQLSVSAPFWVWLCGISEFMFRAHPMTLGQPRINCRRESKFVAPSAMPVFDFPRVAEGMSTVQTVGNDSSA